MYHSLTTLKTEIGKRTVPRRKYKIFPEMKTIVASSFSRVQANLVLHFQLQSRLHGFKINHL